MTTPTGEPGSEQAAESPELDGYGNDTGFAEQAEEADDGGVDAAEDDPS